MQPILSLRVFNGGQNVGQKGEKVIHFRLFQNCQNVGQNICVRIAAIFSNQGIHSQLNSPVVTRELKAKSSLHLPSVSEEVSQGESLIVSATASTELFLMQIGNSLGKHIIMHSVFLEYFFFKTLLDCGSRFGFLCIRLKLHFEFDQCPLPFKILFLSNLDSQKGVCFLHFLIISNFKFTEIFDHPINTVDPYHISQFSFY